MSTYRNRTLETFFRNANNQFPILMVTGPRQVGKTTFLKHLKEENRTYVSLDDPLICALAKDDPGLFLQRFRPPLLIDEVQYAPELLPNLKMAVDKNRDPGQFWLTGSQQFHLMKGASESLAGRVGIFNLLGFSQRELLGQPQSEPFIPKPEVIECRSDSPELLLPDLFEMIWRGSFPGLYQDIPTDRDFFYNSFVQTYLQRDVRDLVNVGDQRAFLRFIRACAARTSQMLNLLDICRISDINQATGKRWLSILESSGIVYLLEPYHSNINKRLVKTPKLYFLDTGLASYLTEWTSPETLEAGAMSGAILETWAIGEIIKSWWHHGKRAPVFYYRDKDTKEIDVLIEQDGVLYPIEIKKTSQPGKDSVRHFKVLESFQKTIGNGILLSFSPTRLPITADSETIPFGWL